jgi:hypothetical protein
MINREPKKEDFRFFILLDNDDYLQKTCWFSFSYNKLDQILQNLHVFPGKLDVYSVDQYTNMVHPILFFNNMKPLKNRIYIKLPKEKKYVLVEDFEKYWILSQLNELNVLFLRLNAENVKIKHLVKHSLVGIHPGIDEYIASMGVQDHDAVEIRYSLPKVFPKIFNSLKYFYYDKWKPIIDARMNEGKFYDEFYFKNENLAFLNDAFYTTMQNCGLTVFSNESKSFELHFEIFYYPDEMIC